MPEPPVPARGTIVTFLDTDTADRLFSRGISYGTRIFDPMTDEPWPSVLRPDGTGILVDEAMIMEVGRSSMMSTWQSEPD